MTQVKSTRMVTSTFVAVMESPRKFCESQKQCVHLLTVSTFHIAAIFPTQVMRSGLNAHLKTHAPDMFRFYSILNARKSKPTAEEIGVAEGTKKFDSRTDLLKFIDSVSTSAERQQTLREALNRAAEHKIVGDSFVILNHIFYTHTKITRVNGIRLSLRNS